VRQYALKRQQVVSALYDIDRQEFDARGVDTYLALADDFLKYFPEAIIFHNLQSQNEIELLVNKHPKANFVFLPFSKLPLFQYFNEISSACKFNLESGKSDLVYKSPKYGILIHSKFFFLNRAQEIDAAESYTWIDIGIARFLPSGSAEVNFGASFLGIAANKAIFEVDIRRLLNVRHVPALFKIYLNGLIGSSQRLVSAAFFSIPGTLLKEFFEYLTFVQNHWVRAGLWDTEQVLLAKSISQFSPELILQRGENPVTLLNLLIQNVKPRREFLKKFIAKILFKTLSN